MTSVRLTDLPGSAQELAETVGLQAALSIVENWGGVGLWIPVEWNPGAETTQRLIVTLGEVAARRLWDVYRGTHICVPKCDRAMHALRDEEIRRRRREGWTVSRLAREYRLTERQIYNILAAQQVDETQADLFDTGT